MKSTFYQSKKDNSLNIFGKFATGFVAFVTILFILPSISSAQAATFYVSSGGNDSASGSQGSPFRTISKGFSAAGAGDTVIVGDGTYGSFTVSHGGNSGGWITVKSQNKWGAKIQGSGDIGIDFDPSGSYVKIQDFEITGFQNGINNNGGGNNVVISGNNIHDIGRTCTGSDYGFDGIYLGEVNNITIDGNVISNIGRLFPGENGCNPSNPDYAYNHDHGLYLNGVSSVTVKNNVFSNAIHGWSIHLYSGQGFSVNNLVIANNTFAFPNPQRDGQIILAETISNAQITNNIFYQPNSAGIQIYGSSYHASYSNVTISNNMTTGGTTTTGSAPNISVSGNFDNTNPQFVNPGASDFHLTQNSPAINKGQSVSSVGTDFEGNGRPYGGTFDIGAFEYTSGSGPAPTIAPQPTATPKPVVIPTATPKPVILPTATPKAVVLSTPTSSSGNYDCTGNGVYLYSDSNYSGNCTKFTGDMASLNGTAVGGDSVSSIQLVGGYTATVYADSDFTGADQTITSDIANLKGSLVGSDSISSLKVYPPSTLACPPAGNVSGGTASMTVSVPQAGNYKIWVSMKGKGNSANTVWLKLDNLYCAKVGDLNGMPSDTWTWVDYENGSVEDKIPSPLIGTGNHTITLIGNTEESGVSIDRILMTLNSSCTPAASGDNGNTCIGISDSQPQTTTAISPTTSTSEKIPPVISITSPKNNAVVSGSGSFTSSASAGDDSGIAWIRMYLDSNLVTTCRRRTSCSMSVKIDQLSIGNHSISVFAQDKAATPNTASKTVYFSKQ